MSHVLVQSPNSCNKSRSLEGAGSEVEPQRTQRALLKHACATGGDFTYCTTMPPELIQDLCECTTGIFP